MEGLYLLIQLGIAVATAGIVLYFRHKEKKEREKIIAAIRELKKDKGYNKNNSLKEVAKLFVQNHYPIRNPKRDLLKRVQSRTDETGQYITILLLDRSSEYEIAGQLTVLLNGNKCIVKVFVFNGIFEGVELLKELDAHSRNRTTIEVEEQVSTTEPFNQLLQEIRI